MSHAPGSPPAVGSTQTAGHATDEGRGRVFPCEGCGADLEFHIGVQQLKCPYCGYEQNLELPDGQVIEQDFHAMLDRLEQAKAQGHADEQGTSEVRCEACSGNVVFTGTLSSTACPFCAAPIQREKIHDSPYRVPVDGVMPFQVDKKRAADQLRQWVDGRWFLPSDFRTMGEQGEFNGVYLPYWTFDTMTANRYRGERGEHYYVEVDVQIGDKKEKRREQRTRWYPASGSFERFFDDVMAFGSAGLPNSLLLNLEPWPIDKCVPFNQQMLAGFLARTYDITLDQGFQDAKGRIDAAIRTECRQRIGGDDQRVHNVESRYNALAYKHLLLPVWLLVFRYKGKAYQIAINAATGEVQGERPWSFAKIAWAILLALGTVGLIALVVSGIGAIGSAISR